MRCSYLPPAHSNLVLRIPPSAIEAKEVTPFPTVGGLRKRYLRVATLTFDHHAGSSVLRLIDFSSDLGILQDLCFHYDY